MRNNCTITVNTISQNRILRFLLSYSDADFGISGILIITATVAMTFGLIGFLAVTTGALQEEFINVGFHNPKFFEDSRGIAGFTNGTLSYTNPTSNYVTYELMRQNIFPIGAVLVFIYILVNAWGEASGLFGRGATKPMFFKFLGMMILVMIFVPAWDVAAVGVEKWAISMLNPMYLHGDDGPCVANPDKVLLLVDEQNRRIVDRLNAIPILRYDESPCLPQLRIDYVYEKAYHGATTENSKGSGDMDADIWSGVALANITAWLTNIVNAVFLGVTKSVLLFTITLTGLIVMTIRELLLAVIISLVPMFVLLSFVPKVGNIFAKLLETIVPLLLIPVITAAVFFTGAGILLDMEDEFNLREPLVGNTADVDAENQELIQLISKERFTFWIASISLLILATGIPILMAPILSGIASQASAMVGTAVLSGVMGAMTTIRSGATGIAAGAQGARASGAGLMSMTGMAGIAKGGAHGLGMGIGAGAMADTSVGMASMASGGGSAFSGIGRDMVNMAGKGPAGGFDPYASALAAGNAATAAATRTVANAVPVIHGAMPATGGGGGSGSMPTNPPRSGESAPFGHQEAADVTSRSETGGSFFNPKSNDQPLFRNTPNGSENVKSKKPDRY